MLDILTLYKRRNELDRAVVCRGCAPCEGHVAELDRAAFVSHAGFPLSQAVQVHGNGGDGDKPPNQCGVTVRAVLGTGVEHEGVKILTGLQAN